jgi:hypothetical protein
MVSHVFTECIEMPAFLADLNITPERIESFKVKVPQDTYPVHFKILRPRRGDFRASAR